MLNSKKIAAAAGVLWSIALIGAGQAFGHDGSGGSGTCVDDGKGNVRCVQKSVYRDKDGNLVEVVSNQSQTCASGGCDSHITIGGKKF
ncbi:hypothetical protein [Streptomyces sp. NPDC002088]|uniref:hypothetical protein n=1 Tax=unclassified Streptomyces TaxID=2593676 RepID=UPI003331B6F3